MLAYFSSAFVIFSSDPWLYLQSPLHLCVVFGLPVLLERLDRIEYHNQDYPLLTKIIRYSLLGIFLGKYSFYTKNSIWGS